MLEFAALLLPLGGVFQAAPRPVEPPAVVSLQSPDLFATPKKDDAVAKFHGYLSSWERAGEGLPKPLVLDKAVSISVRMPKRPGEAAAGKLEETLGELGVGVSIYAICPHGSPIAPDGSCEKLYFQVQTALSGVTQAFCASALSKHDALPFPVQQCGGPDPEDEGWLIGATLHRVPFQKASP